VSTAELEPIEIELEVDPAGLQHTESLFRHALWPLLQREDWESLRWLSSHPNAPESVLLLLVHYPKLHDALGHRTGPLKVLEVLAEGFGYLEAVLSVGKRYYTDPAFPTPTFASFLRRHRNDKALLRSLCYLSTASASKERVFQQAIQDSAELQALCKLLNEAEAVKSTDNIERIQAAFDSREPKLLLAIASNPQTPISLLSQLAELRGFKNASNIRRSANENLKARR
jgi:hypothetical protein